MKRNQSTYRLGWIFILLLVLELAFWALFVGGYYAFKQFDPSLTLHYREWWPLLLLLPVSGLMYVLVLAWRNRALKRLADFDLLQAIAPGISPVRSVLKYILWRLAIGFLLIGLLDPKLGSKIEEVETKGIDLMVAIDVSNSMLAEDLKPNRLDLTKRTVKRLINDLQGNRIGLVIFAGDAYVQLPITDDVQAAKIFLDAIETSSVPTQGTAIGAAVELCAESFDPESEAGKAILVITDGENHEDDAVAAAESAFANGISVFAVGAGLPGGAPIPEYNSRGQRTGFKKDASGTTVVTSLDENTLIQMVSAAEGVFVRATETRMDLRPILSAIDQLEKGELGSISFTDHEHRFRIFLIFGIILLVVEMLISERKWKSA